MEPFYRKSLLTWKLAKTKHEFRSKEFVWLSCLQYFQAAGLALDLFGMQLVLNEAFITLISMFVNLSMPRLLHADHTHPNFNRNKHLTHCFRVLYLYDTISMTANI